MAIKKQSFFQRLSGSIPVDDYDAYDDDLGPVVQPITRRPIVQNTQPAMAVQNQPHMTLSQLEEDEGGQLPVDVYQTANEIVIRTFIAGVRAEDINLSISRDMVVIEGSRSERDNVEDSDYYTRELFWGSFSRTILLAQEVDVDTCSAASKDGLLTITLPKLDKARQTKLRVKAG